eukprot:g9018.t1
MMFSSRTGGARSQENVTVSRLIEDSTHRVGDHILKLKMENEALEKTLKRVRKERKLALAREEHLRHKFVRESVIVSKGQAKYHSKIKFMKQKLGLKDEELDALQEHADHAVECAGRDADRARELLDSTKQSFDRQIERMAKELAEKDSVIAGLESALKDSDKRFHESTLEKQKENHNLSKQLAVATTTFRVYENNAKEAKREIKRLAASNSALVEQIQALKEQLVEKESTLTSECHTFETSLLTDYVKREEMSKQISRINTEHHALSESMRVEHHREKLSTDAELRNLQRAIKRKDQEIDQLQHSVKLSEQETKDATDMMMQSVSNGRLHLGSLGVHLNRD